MPAGWMLLSPQLYRIQIVRWSVVTSATWPHLKGPAERSCNGQAAHERSCVTEAAHTRYHGRARSGDVVGLAVGDTVGASVGLVVGDVVGLAVGELVISMHSPLCG